MSIQLKPGKWKTRDGLVAVVEFRTECQGRRFRWMGFVGSLNRWWADDGQDMTSNFDIIAPYTEPRLRPWKPEEVPVGALIRRGDDGPPMVILTRSQGGNPLLVDVWDGSRLKGIPAELLLSDYTISKDCGATWSLCGVMEEQA